MRTFLDAVWLSVGTMTAIPVPPPSRVDRSVARVAMLFAPWAVIPVAVVAAGMSAVLIFAGTPRIAAGMICVALIALGTKAIHLDGLADTFDAAGVPGDRNRALAIMKQGDVGPMGAVSLIVSISLQAVCFGEILARPSGWIVAAAAIAASRVGLSVACMTMIPAARPGGLGQAVAGTVPWWAAGLNMVLWCCLVSVAATSLVASAAVAVAFVGVGLILVLAWRRFGGITGDVLGASVEICTTVLVVGLTMMP